MEALWNQDRNPRWEFVEGLLNKRIDMMLADPEWLKRMRYNYQEVRFWQKKAGHIFRERGINLMQEIAKAHGESWIEEEQKSDT